MICVSNPKKKILGLP